MRSVSVVALLLAVAAPAFGGASVAPATTLARPVAFEHGSRAGRQVALTFDACTTRGHDPYDPRIIRILDALHAPATVFVGGGWAEEEGTALRALASDPLIELGNHTFTHPHLTRLTDARIRDELLRTQAEIAAVTGRVPALFRPPYGEYDAHVVRAAAGVGLTTVEYDLPSGDPDPHATARGLVEWVLREARPGSIVVMHINHPGFHTADALPAIVDGLRARGFDLVTVGQLLRDAPPSARVVATGAPSGRPGRHRGHAAPSAAATLERHA